jgi:hypothetical protein
MKTKGDLSGEKVWQELAEVLEGDDPDKAPTPPAASYRLSPRRWKRDHHGQAAETYLFEKRWTPVSSSA